LLVHIGDPPTNQAAFLESQVIPTIQYVSGLALSENDLMFKKWPAANVDQ